MKRSWGRPDLLASVFLAALTVVVYAPLTVQGRVLASLDSLVYFYPNAVFLAERLREGQIPFWDPYLFAGVPFLANSQVGALYPPNWLYLLGPVSRIYALLVVAHVWWLAVGTYLLGRVSLDLGSVAALFAAVAVGFGGFVGGMNGHLNQLEALAWAPLAIALVERGAARRSWRLQILAAFPFALAALAGHSQELYIGGLVAGLAGGSRVIQLWGSGTSDAGPRRPDPRRPTPDPRFAVLVDLVRLAVGPILGILIASAQLIPTLELTRLSIRSTGLDFFDATSFSLPPSMVPISLLPTANQAPPSTEWLGYVGVSSIVLAMVGIWRRPKAEAWWLAGLALLGLVLAFGRYTPIYYLAFELVPGVRLFRVPARWLTLWTLGLGLLAGWGVEALLSSRRDRELAAGRGVALPANPPSDPESVQPGDAPRSRSRPALTDQWAVARPGGATGERAAARSDPEGLISLRVQSERRNGNGGQGGQAAISSVPGAATENVRSAIVVGVGIVVLFLTILAYVHRRVVSWPSLATLGLWVATLLGLALAWWVGRRWPRIGAVGLLALLVGELSVAATGLPLQRAVWASAVESTRLSVDHLLALRSPDRILSLGDNSFDPGDIAELRQMLAGNLSSDAQSDYIAAVKHVEGLTPNLSLRYGIRTIDGYDGGVLPLDRYDELKRLFPQQAPPAGDGRLRLQLKSAPDPRLLGWLNVRYLVINRLNDRWIDGTYYDLAVSQNLLPGATTDLSIDHAFPSTAIGIMLRGQTPLVPDGSLQVQAGDQTITLPLGSTRVPGQHVASDFDRSGVWLWTVDLPRPTAIQEVRVTWLGGQPAVLRSLSLIDRRSGANQTVTVAPDYHLDFIGDVKIYENRDALPRAFLSTGLDVVPNIDAVLTALASPTWNAEASAVASAEDVIAGQAFRGAGAPGDARIVADQPEQVVVDTSAAGRRVLVLTDSYYPGWQATVDGVRAPILPVNAMFRGVILGPGSHRVVFTYDPTSWRLGVLLSLIGIVGALVGFRVARR